MSITMGRWRKTIKLKDLLSEDDSPENVRRVAAKVTARLKREPEYDPFGDDVFSDVVERMNDIAKSDMAGCGCDRFNDVLADLYDWADAERVWIA